MMMTRTRLMVLLGILGSAWGSAAAAQSLTIDDFTTGPHRVTLRREAQERDVQRGSMAGGFRHTRFLSAFNPLHRPASLQIGRGWVFVEAGVKAFHRLELTYGVDAKGGAAPLNLDLSAYDRFRLRFAASDLMQNINVVVFTHDGVGRAQLGFNQAPGPEPFDLDFPFADFVDQLGEADFSDVDHIVVVIQDGNAFGSSDYALTGFTALRP
jgi:hypothetical protein